MENKDIKIGDVVKFRDTDCDVEGEGKALFLNKDNNFGWLILLTKNPDLGGMSWKINKFSYGIPLLLTDLHLGRSVRWVQSRWITEIVGFYPPPVDKPKYTYYHCIRCNYGDKYTTEANMTEDRFMCWTCRDSASYMYPGCFLKKT